MSAQDWIRVAVIVAFVAMVVWALCWGNDEGDD